ncbi:MULTISPECIES: acyl-CoA dehydrogenase C-terminal domain-containing protein [Idiomarina]|uniref:3-methylmercaptopropionyl-CoA dehydrogenase n=1 Tax=Idiomarina piscisalsi TaxID=1096243 RepID=A0A432YTP1_9GAMM|nr:MULTISPECIES: acyl-CoA dehydrogenase C-terminal domain-containing protein [Idiomarina]MCJ8316923.1 acyl-CoA dehydrogenase C-terminal domain-containing protein [Idiomarina sp.]NQZ16613.1 acyl-CoA dehydrogenase C-terminal domain-containing protein [Idiomarina sp.]RUO66688.1 acyl-CoA dehydrogenase [Idiomarina piscisalsi]
MADYRAPRDDMDFVLHDVFNVAADWEQAPELAEMMDVETAGAILDEGAKVAENLVAPLAREADEEGVKFEDGVVTTPKGYKENFRQLAEGGWVGVTANPEFGGMGLPKSLSAQYEEMLCSADIAFSLYPGLTSGAIMAIDSHGSDELKNHYLPRMVSGEWTGTMCLTEPHAGTDLGIIKSKAIPSEDGSFEISGTKIFITGGEHDLADNIVHLVLAKLPDAPAGTKGISLFVVPKFLSDAEGNLTERNAVSCGSIEHKMGIHGSATCVMNFDGAKGWLVGEPHRGLPAMFTMMNYERLGVGIQGLGAAERSYQNALEYAKDRIQGRGAKATRNDSAEADSILVHGDVRRMLLTMKALTEGGRAFSTWVGQQLDRSKYSQDDAVREKADAMVALLTPVAKAFLTDTGLESTIHGQQVFGGHGYVREWGQEQLVRDTRIAQIYEGTNGIQALDLLGRKVGGSRGELLKPFVEEIATFLQGIAGNSNWAKEAETLQKSLQDLTSISEELLQKAATDENLVNSVAVEYLHLVGYISYGYMWLRMAVAAEQKQAEKPYLASKIKTARFYFARIMPRTHALLGAIKDGSESLYLHDDEQF